MHFGKDHLLILTLMGPEGFEAVSQMFAQYMQY